MDNGTYRARAVSTVLFFSSKKETPGLKVTFKLETGDTIDHDMWLSDAAVEYTQKTLQEQLGFRGTDISVFLDCDDCTKILPNVVELVIENEDFTTDSGKVITTPKVKYINTPGNSQVKKMTAADAANFAARFKARFATRAPVQLQQDLSGGKEDPFPF